MEEGQVCCRGRRPHQVCPAVILRLRVGFKDLLKVSQVLRKSRSTEGLAPGNCFVLLLLVVLAHIDRVVGVVRLGETVLIRFVNGAWRGTHFVVKIQHGQHQLVDGATRLFLVFSFLLPCI